MGPGGGPQEDDQGAQDTASGQCLRLLGIIFTAGDLDAVPRVDQLLRVVIVELHPQLVTSIFGTRSARAYAQLVCLRAACTYG